jgi:rhamnosyl/mannosyltransferase
VKILQVNKLYAPAIGGVETVVKDVAEGLSGITDMSVLVCTQKGGRKEELYNGVKVVRAKSFGTFLSVPLSVDFFSRYKKMSADADIVQMHTPFPPGDLAVFLFGAQGRLAVWWHSDIVRQKLLAWLLSPLIRHTLKQADLIIVASDTNIESSSFLPKYRDKCKVLPYGLDFEKYPEAEEGFLSKKLNMPCHKRLLFAGRLVYYKGVDILVDAMRWVYGAELFIVGSGPLEKGLRKKAVKYGLLDKIHFLGTATREELLAALNGCDIFVFPSTAKSEAFGIVQLEAMHYGKPVINTNLPTAVPTVSVHGETGLTVHPGNAEKLAEAINSLVKNDALRIFYGENAARRVRENYDLRHMVKDLLEFYKTLKRDGE